MRLEVASSLMAAEAQEHTGGEPREGDVGG